MHRLGVFPCLYVTNHVFTLQMWAGEYVGPHAALVATLLRSGEAKTLAKATCEGLGGGFTAVKKAGCGAAGYGAGFGADGCAMAAGEEGFTALEGAPCILLRSAPPVPPNAVASAVNDQVQVHVPVQGLQRRAWSPGADIRAGHLCTLLAPI